jgi:asparagine synthase (glutamine-hydrolysing)
VCGVFFTSKTSVDDNSLGSIKEILTCRGPDKQQILKTKFGFFCQTRLEIIGLGKCGDQPFSENLNEDCLVYNGEIYNFRSFCKVLNFETKSDTEILYRILKLKRYDLITQIRGMYSFIYYNFKEQYIITARDFFGIKPLYCLNSNDGEISFASVPSVLLKIAKNKEIDLLSVSTYLATGLIHNGYSMFKSIKKVIPGNLERWEKTNGQWNAESIELKKYRHEFISESESILNSVSIHLTSDVPVGVLMSGGVDSTLLAALAAKEVPNLKTYSLINPKFPQINEAEYALHNSSLIGTEHHEVEFNMSDSLEQIIKIVNSTGEPFSDAAYIPLSILCREVSKDLKVVLAGEGADEIFSGYRRYDVENLFQNKTIKNISMKIMCKLFGSDFYLNNSPNQLSRIISFIIEEIKFYKG